MVTDISHQIKTPISSLKICFEMYEESENAEEKRDFLSRSHLQVSKLKNLTEALVNISRLETDIITLKKESVNLRKLLIQSVNSVYDKALDKNIKIEVEEFENLELTLDEKWTVEAILNVLDNGVKYSYFGSVIKITVEKLVSFVRIEISDEGIGIEKNESLEIFKRFYRGTNSTVKNTEGSGVGLYLTRSILEKQGGGISARRSEHSGTTFIINLRL